MQNGPQNHKANTQELGISSWQTLMFKSLWLKCYIAILKDSQAVLPNKAFAALHLRPFRGHAAGGWILRGAGDPVKTQPQTHTIKGVREMAEF